MRETTQKKLANMPAKRKCKKGIAIQTDLNRPNENAVEDLSCTTKTQTRLKVKHPISSTTPITTFAAKESVVIIFFVICRTHFNIFLKKLAAIERSPAPEYKSIKM